MLDFVGREYRHGERGNRLELLTRVLMRESREGVGGGLSKQCTKASCKHLDLSYSNFCSQKAYLFPCNSPHVYSRSLLSIRRR